MNTRQCQELAQRWMLAGAIAISFAARPLAAQAPRADSVADDASALFRNLAGGWSCKGGFARGGALAADLTFTPLQSGRVLLYQHADRKPTSYWQSAMWALEPKSGHIVSLAMTGSTSDRAGGAPALYVASRWSPTEIVLEADTLKAPPFAPNRFTYTVRGDSSAGLKMVWTVSRNGTWAVGDSLLCTRGS